MCNTDLKQKMEKINIEGNLIYNQAAPSRVHQTILGELYTIINNHIKSKGGVNKNAFFVRIYYPVFPYSGVSVQIQFENIVIIMASAQVELYTEDDYYNLSEDIRAELIEGNLIYKLTPCM